MSRGKAVPPRIESDSESFMQRLRTDHAGLSRLLREIDMQQSLLRTDPESARPLLVEALRYLLQYQHAFHDPREDRLFARIQQRTPHLTRDMQRLLPRAPYRATARGAPCCGPGSRNDGATIRAAGRQAGTGTSGLRAPHAQSHAPRRGRVLCALRTRAQGTADWQALVFWRPMNDPMTDSRRFATDTRCWPRVLRSSVREIGGAGDAPSSSHLSSRASAQSGATLRGLWGVAARRARPDAGEFRQPARIRSPAGLMRVVRPVYSRNRRFAGRCVTEPARWIRETAGAIFAASWVRESI